MMSTRSLSPSPAPTSFPVADLSYANHQSWQKLRNAETMAGFHRCLERAGVSWQHVDFPGASGSSLPAAHTETAGTETATTPAATAARVGGSERHLSQDGAAYTTGVSEAHQHVLRKGRTCSEDKRHPQPPPPPHPGVGLWCHPEDVKTVRFCVCGGGWRRGAAAGT